MKKLKKTLGAIVSPQNNPDIKCNSCEKENIQKFGHIVVQNLEELYRFPCKLRVPGMSATVVEENYAEFQLKATAESKCNNINWQVPDGESLWKYVPIQEGYEEDGDFIENLQGTSARLKKGYSIKHPRDLITKEYYENNLPKIPDTVYYIQSKIILSDYMKIPIVINLTQNIDVVTDVFLSGIRLEDNTYVLTDSNILTILELPEIYMYSTSYKFIVKGVVEGDVLIVDSSTTFEIDENGYLIAVDDINNTSMEIDINQNIVLEGDNPRLFPDMKIENSNLTIRE